MSWDEFTRIPSRYTTDIPNRHEREELLNYVTTKGYTDDYFGIRISTDGKRFRITQTTVWNVYDLEGNKMSQAATFSEWSHLE